MKRKNKVVPDKPHFQVTAGIVWKDGKVLIARRPPGKHLAGMWEFPGGKKEQGESLRECLRREMKEELGLDIEVKDYLVSLEHDYGDRIITLHVFNCSYAGKGPENKEYEEFCWVSPSELGQFDFPPPDRKIIELLD